MKTKRFVLIAVMIGMAMSVSAQEAKESKYGADSVACVTNLSTYREYFKQWEAARYAPDAISMEMVAAWRGCSSAAHAPASIPTPMVRRSWTTSSAPTPRTRTPTLTRFAC